MKAQILTPMFFVILSIAQAAQHKAMNPKEYSKEHFEYLKKQYAFEEWREETSDSRLQSPGGLQQRLERSILLPVRISVRETSLRLEILPEADLCGALVRVACADSVFSGHEAVLGRCWYARLRPARFELKEELNTTWATFRCI